MAIYSQLELTDKKAIEGIRDVSCKYDINVKKVK